jgi:lysozyme family protein
MTVNPSRQTEFRRIAKRLFDAKERYVSVQNKTGVPWYMIAVAHEREASQNWNTQLAQGDPLHRKSTHVPRGMGPYDTWEEGALAAVNQSGLSKVKDWRLEKVLYYLERFNGWGYHNHGVPSAYLWAGSSAYRRGKYIADGVWSSTAVDTQSGCAPIIKYLMDLDPTIKPERETPPEKGIKSPKVAVALMQTVQPKKETSMLNTLVAILASFMPGFKTKIWAALLAGSGALLVLMEYLQTIDLSQWVPAQYLGPALMIIGIITYILRSITKTDTTPSVTIVPSTLAAQSIVTVQPSK